MSDSFELGSTRCTRTIEYRAGGVDHLGVVFQDLGVCVEIQSLEEKPKASNHKNLITVEAEGEAHLSFDQKLTNLDNVFA